MSECGKRVGAGVVTYPCTVEVFGGTEHGGPCMSPDNPASGRKRAAWLRDTTPRPLAEMLSEPVSVTARRAQEGLRELREGYHPDPHHLPEPGGKVADRGGQPAPTHIPGGPSMHDLLVREIEKRKALGLSRYGTILQAGNGRNALQDLLDELIDGCVYLMQEIEERRLRVERERLRVERELGAIEQGG